MSRRSIPVLNDNLGCSSGPSENWLERYLRPSKKKQKPNEQLTELAAKIRTRANEEDLEKSRVNPNWV
jgi:hypothetical protein